MKTNINRLTGRLSTKYWVAVLGMALALLTGPGVFRPQPVWAADSCTAPSTNYGVDTVHATVPSTGSYTVWTHMKIPSSSANSVLMNINGTCYNVGANSSMPANTWTWVNYYDGRSSNAIVRSLNQGALNVVLTGTSTGVMVDQLEFVQGSCVPSGSGGNCISTGGGTTTGGGGGGGGGTTGGGSDGGSVSVPTDGSFTPTDTDVPTQVGGSVTLQPTLSGDDPVKEVQYYLDKKLLATITTPPFSYHLDTKKILNGTYTLTTKTTYESGNVNSTSQKIIVKNPFSLMQLMLLVRHYIVLVVIALVVLFVGFKLLRKWLRSRHTPTDGMPPTDGGVGGGSGSGGENPYTPLPYSTSPYPAPPVGGPTAPSPSPLPPLPVPPVIGEGTPRQQY